MCVMLCGLMRGEAGVLPQLADSAFAGKTSWRLAGNTDENTLPTKEDYLPSPTSSNYQAYAKELQERLRQWRDDDSKLWQTVDRYDEKEAALARRESFMRDSKRLAELRAERLPGVYVTKLYNIIEWPTKEAAARAVKRREMQDLTMWQHSVNRAMRDILHDLTFQRKTHMADQDGLLTDAECMELDLSAYERNMIESGSEWNQFAMDSGNMHIFGVQPPHVPLFPHDGAQNKWDADAYAKRTEKYYEPESRDFMDAFTSYVEFSTNIDAFADAEMVDSFAHNIATTIGSRQRVWLVRQLCLAHGVRHLAPWRLLVEVGAILVDEMARAKKQDGLTSEIGWFRNAVASQYFKGQISRLADEAFRTWLSGRLNKLLGRQITEADLKYVCKDDVLLRRRDYMVRKPHDGGNVLPHPFTIFGCTFGKAYDKEDMLGTGHTEKNITSWNMNLRLDSYFGKVHAIAYLAPRAKIAYSVELQWYDIKAKEELLAKAKDVRADIEKRLGVKLGDFFFEDGKHVCDEATWWKADGVEARSRSVFWPIRIEIEAIADSLRITPGGRLLKLAITDTEVEALVEKERKESPLKYDREAELRRYRECARKARRKKSSAPPTTESPQME